MAENPLLPNAELRALHALLRRAGAEAEPSSAPARRGSAARTAAEAEALLAGTLLQCQAGDLVVASKEFTLQTSTLLTPAGGRRSAKNATAVPLQEVSPRLMLAAGLASGLRRSVTDRLVLVYLASGSSEPQWAEAIAWAQEELLPLILVCADQSGADAFHGSQGPEPDILDWPRFQQTAGKAKLPILSVDGQDAVAVYRVMQESVLRARAGGGPAVLWAVLPSRNKGRATRSEALSPVDRLEHYMRARKISFP